MNKPVVGDLQRQVLEQSHLSAKDSANSMQKMAYVASGFGVLGMGGFLTIGALRAAEVVSSGFAAAGMQGGLTMCMIGSLGAIAMHFVAKHEQRNAQTLEAVVQQYDEGKSVNRIIEHLGGEHMSAKLGVFRVQNGAVQIPKPPKRDVGYDSAGF